MRYNVGFGKKIEILSLLVHFQALFSVLCIMALTPKVSVIYESTVSRKRKWHSRLPLFGFIPHRASDVYFVHKFVDQEPMNQRLKTLKTLKNPKTHAQ